MKSRTWGDSLYIGRTLYQLAFYVLINLIVIAVIQGIIIDTFSALRSGQEELLVSAETKCLLCGDEKFDYENRKKVRTLWYDHIQDEHNIFAFIEFIILIKDKPSEACDEFERYFQRLIEQKNFDEIRALFPKKEVYHELSKTE
eukprot:TRINITY_DN13036_c0_g1_i1.p1 TRINITY_DN13036_c0_g1~~TRINITY_DN13036_c0_g1_i1.p1  ORF type:complete len:144 (-),score=15.78 TRINITY_DN13036_c0_g1_i1:84-515(-)